MTFSEQCDASPLMNIKKNPIIIIIKQISLVLYLVTFQKNFKMTEFGKPVIIVYLHATFLSC